MKFTQEVKNKFTQEIKMKFPTEIDFLAELGLTPSINDDGYFEYGFSDNQIKIILSFNILNKDAVIKTYRCKDSYSDILLQTTIFDNVTEIKLNKDVIIIITVNSNCVIRIYPNIIINTAIK